MGNLFGQKTARRAQKKQEDAIQKQRQVDELELAKQEDVIARKKQMGSSGKAGRRSLIKTSETGVKSSNLGGTI